MNRFYICLIITLVIFLIPNIYAQSSEPESGSPGTPGAERAEGAEKAQGAETAEKAGAETAEKAKGAETTQGAEKAPEAEKVPEAEKASEVESTPTPNSNAGGCLIATATYGSELAPQVQLLREIRGNTILTTTSGTSFMTAFNAFYYSFSPTVADLERQNPVFKEAVKVAITPLLSTLSILNYVDIDSEAEMLGYGIAIILLNIGMYFVAPTVAIVKIGKLSKK